MKVERIGNDRVKDRFLLHKRKNDKPIENFG